MHKGFVFGFIDIRDFSLVNFFATFFVCFVDKTHKDFKCVFIFLCFCSRFIKSVVLFLNIYKSRLQVGIQPLILDLKYFLFDYRMDCVG